MKVLQLGKIFHIKGGVEKVMFDLVNGLSSKGIYCDMLCASVNNHYQEVSLDNGESNLAISSITKKFGTMFSRSMIIKLRSI